VFANGDKMERKRGERPLTNLLQQGASNAIQTCLGVTPEDRVLIIGDEHTWEVDQALAAQAQTITPTVLLLPIEAFGLRPLLHFPEPMQVAMKQFQPTVGLYAAQGQTGELPGFRAKLVEFLAYRLQCRYAHMVNITRQIMEMGMSTDYQLLYEISRKVWMKVKNAQHIHVTSEKGTAVTATFDPNIRWVASHGKIRQGEPWQNLPGTEVYTCPASVNGVVVAEELGDYFSERYGLLKEPVSFFLQDGYCWDVRCADHTIEEEVKHYLFTAPYCNRVGEFAIGTNVGLDRLIGNLLQDEKYPGLHIAFGHPYPTETGASWDAPRHLDVIPTGISMWVDGNPLMKQGMFLLD
jgi:leucyl aminopeptidase (aminopeptidase T)